MKRNLILTILACGASAMLGLAAQGQTATPTPSAAPSGSPAVCPAGRHMGEHKGGLLKHLTEALSLTGTQQAQIAPILEQAKPQMKAIHDEAQTKRKALIDSVSTQITPLLTTDQQAKFTEMVQKFESRPAGAGHRFERHGGPAGPEAKGDVLQHLTTALSLTTDQQAQVKPILDAAHAQMESIRQNASLTPDQKMTQVKDTMDAAHSQISGILTPAQQKQLAALKEKFHHGHGPGSQPSATPTPAAAN
jgi:Spy/CpxP family protein refolding chaperone